MNLKSILKKLYQFSFFDTLKHSSIYFSGTLLIQILSIVSFPVYTSYFTTTEYGIVNMFSSYTVVLATLMTWNIHIGITRYYFDLEVNQNDIKGYMATSTLSSFLLTLMVGFMMYLFRYTVAKIINLPVDTIIYIVCMSYFAVVYYIYYQWKVAEKKSSEITTMNVVLQYSKFGISLLLLILISWAPETFYRGKIIGEFVATLVISFVLIILVWPMLDWKAMRWSHLKYGLAFGLPLVPYSLGMYFLNFFDQWYIGAKLGRADVGLYSFAYKIGLLLGGLISALHSAAIPEYHNWMNNQKYDQVRSQVLSIHRLTIVAAVFLLLFAIDIGTLLSSKKAFIEALEIAPIIIGGYVFFGMAQLFNRGIQYKKNNIYLTVIYLFAGVINVVLNIYYIPLFGYHAAAYTTLVSYILMALLAWLLTTYYLKIPYLPVLKMSLNLIPFIILCIGFYFLGLHKIGLNWSLIFVKALVFGVVAGLMFRKSLLKVFQKG